MPLSCFGNVLSGNMAWSEISYCCTLSGLLIGYYEISSGGCWSIWQCCRENWGLCYRCKTIYWKKNPPSRSLNTKNLPKRMFKKSFISFSFFFRLAFFPISTFWNVYSCLATDSFLCIECYVKNEIKNFNSKEYHCNSLRFPHAVKLSVSANI